MAQRTDLLLDFCTKCGTLHATPFKWCEPCREKQQAYKAAFLARSRGQEPAVPICRYCGAPVAKRRSLRCDSPECAKQYRAERHERAKARNRERYATDPEFRTRMLAHAERWRVENREAWLAHNRNYYARTYARRYEVFAELSRRRRARLKGLTVVVFTPTQLSQRLSMFAGCWMCGDVATAIDHVKPISKGGAHILANLRPICTPCNRQKWNTWPYPTTRRRRVRP